LLELPSFMLSHTKRMQARKKLLRISTKLALKGNWRLKIRIKKSWVLIEIANNFTGLEFQAKKVWLYLIYEKGNHTVIITDKNVSFSEFDSSSRFSKSKPTQIKTLTRVFFLPLKQSQLTLIRINWRHDIYWDKGFKKVVCAKNLGLNSNKKQYKWLYNQASKKTSLWRFSIPISKFSLSFAIKKEI
jgi:hypothetical protein